jgi:autotransporter passenger strand-loop-strand repeat protein
LALGAGATFDNARYVNSVSGIKYAGTISGGAAGNNGLINYGPPASAGAGVSVGTNATMINGGFIVGGAAAVSSTGQVTYGAAGVESGGSVLNTGVILGGAGGSSSYGFAPPGSVFIGGTGGVGVDGGFVVNSGTIEGGAGGYGYTAYGAEGDAVDAGTLVVDPGAVFIGDVNVSILEVAGTSALALSGFGTQFDASGAIIFDAGSHWTVEGDVGGFTGGRAIDGFASGDAIVLNGASITSETFETGIGLELSIGGSEVNLAIAGNFDTHDFSVVNSGNATIILTPSLTTGAPELTVPGSKSLAAGAAKKLTGITLSETPTAAGETFTVILSDKDGLLSATGSGIAGSGTTRLTLSGSLAQVNAELATLKDRDYTAPTDTITVSATDSLDGVAATKTIAVTVDGTIGSGKYLAVPKGVNAGSLTVTHGGVELVQSGGSASGTELNAKGLQLVLGAANFTKIHGGYQIVGPDGVATGTTIELDGYEIVSDGGDAANTTIAAGGTLLLTDGAHSAGVIDFAGSNGALLLGGSTLPTTIIDDFNLNGSTGDAIVLAGSTYDAGHDTVRLSSGNVLNLDLDGKIEKLFLNPTQNFAGHDFTLSANRFGQVMITDPVTGAAAVKAGLLSPPKSLAALDNALLNTKALATLLDVGISAGWSRLAGIGFFATLEMAPFSARESNLAAIGSFSSAH